MNKTWIRKISAILLVCVMLVTGLPATVSATAYSDNVERSEEEKEGLENSWRYEDGVDIGQMEDGISTYSNDLLKAANQTATSFISTPNGAKKGIDVSEHNRQIDWNQVKASGIEFAIIRCGYGQNYTSQDDERWSYNVSECERLGIPYGVYLYSYAKTPNAASSEADHVLRLLSGHKPTYPVYYDMEDKSTVGVGNDMLAQIASVFCSKISGAGYTVGIYANKYWFDTYLTNSVFSNSNWSRWVAQYPYVNNGAISCSYTGKYDVWQFTSTGVVSGIGNNVDLNYWVSGSIPQPTPSAQGNVSYETHVQTYGWTLGTAVDGAVSGTTNQAKRLEAIKINNITGIPGDISYQVHVQTYGWRPWAKNGEMAGTSGESKRLEAIRIQLSGEVANQYDVYYRVHAQTYGWLGWAKNGEDAGTKGFSKRLEAIQIVFVKKGQTPSEGTIGASYIENGKSASNASNAGYVNYQTHIQTYGTQSYVYDGSLAGTVGEAKRLEAIRIQVNNDKLGVSGGITYRTHVQTKGWLDWVSDGAVSGTEGLAKRMEAIQIQLTGDLANQYDVYYRTQVQTYGWLGWAKNGESAGTEGHAKRMEAIQIVLVPKNSAAPNSLPAASGRAAFIK